MRALPGAAAVALIVACSPSAPPAAPSSEPEVLVVPVGMRAAPAAPDLATEAAPEPPPAPLATEPLVFGQPRHFGEPHPDAETTPSGLRHLRITAGEGQRHPGPRDRVEVHYEGWTTDGVAFDSSLERGRPSDFGLHQVIAGWTEGLQLMVEGEQRRFWIPGALAYGDDPNPGRPTGMLVFDVELRHITPALPLPPTPKHLAAPSPTAKRLPSGVAIEWLAHGGGRTHPLPSQKVKVHYTGWDTTGHMFDSSVQRGRPVDFPVTAVIKGFAEGLQAMVVGDRILIWIPASLAYGNTPRTGAPAGDLIFEIELLAIQ